jgi:hypothetical protein
MYLILHKVPYQTGTGIRLVFCLRSYSKSGMFFNTSTHTNTIYQGCAPYILIQDWYLPSYVGSYLGRGRRV